MQDVDFKNNKVTVSPNTTQCAEKQLKGSFANFKKQTTPTPTKQPRKIVIEKTSSLESF